MQYYIMHPIVTDGLVWSVGLPACHYRETCKMAEPITKSFGLWTQVGPGTTY